MKKQVSNTRISSIHLLSGIVKENHKKIIGLEHQKERLNGQLTKKTGKDETSLLELAYLLIKLRKSTLRKLHGLNYT
jgi:hypothetical protein